MTDRGEGFRVRLASSVPIFLLRQGRPKCRPPMNSVFASGGVDIAAVPAPPAIMGGRHKGSAMTDQGGEITPGSANATIWSPHFAPDFASCPAESLTTNFPRSFLRLHLPQQSEPSGRRTPLGRPVAPSCARHKRGKLGTP